MIKTKTLLPLAALATAALGSLSFALAQAPSAAQPAAAAPVASTEASSEGENLRAYFVEMTAPAAAATFSSNYQRYAAESRLLRGNAAARAQAATERAASEATQQAWTNENAQRALLNNLSAPGLGVKVLYRAQTALNGIAVMARPDQVAALEKLPGVQRVIEVVPMKMDAVSSLNFVGTRNFWNTSGINAHGEGVGVGVIDTGIDFVHTGNAGPGGSGYATGVTSVGGGTPATTFPTSKVVWGYDLVGDAYSGTNSPVPDPNPMDTNGHGTACASLIAGFGVNSDGTTYTGSYTSVVPDISTLRISPGFAPQASLFAFRVFGTSGSTNVSSQAIDIATALRLWQLSPDGTALPPAISNLSPAAVAPPRTPVLSVINMSLGSGNGQASAYNDGTVAVQNAAAAGLSMIISAGNSYDNIYVVGSPSVATGSISVAATFNDKQPGATANAPANGSQPPLNVAMQIGAAAAAITSAPNDLPPTAARYANPPLGDFQHTAGTSLAATLTAALKNDAGEPVTDASGNPIAGVSNPYPGKVVLIDRGVVGFHQKALAAARAGAAAVVIVNNRPGSAPGMAAAAGFPVLSIPVVSVTDVDGALMSNTGVANVPPARPGLTIGLQPENPANADEVTGYSSRGPRRLDNRLKPDMAAPAENVTVNVATTGNGVGSFNGTSSAAPHVSGAMTLLRQLTNSGGTTPAWTMEELKALIMNSATGNPLLGGANGTIRYGLSRVGVGRLNLAPAGGMPTAVAMSTDADFPVSISFGSVEVPVAETVTIDKTFKVVDKGPVPLSQKGVASMRTFNLSFDTVNAVPGVSFSFPDGPTIDVPAGGSATARVRITAVGSLLRHVREAATTATQVFALGPPATLLPRTFLTEAGGNIILTESGGAGNQMRLSVHALPRPNSSLSVTPASLVLPATSASQVLTFAGNGIDTGNNLDTVANSTADIKSHAKAFELQYDKPSVQSDPLFKTAEITKVGVTSDFARRTLPFDTATTNNQSAVVVFAVATAADYNTPSSSGPDIQILVDRNGDFVEDITVRSFAWNDPSQGTGTFGSNMFLSVTNPFGSGTLTTTGFFTNILVGRAMNTLNNNTMMLPVNAQRLGLTAAASRINYKVKSSFYFGTYNSETPWMTYDLAKPGVDASVAVANEPFVLNAIGGSSTSATINTPQYNGNRSLGVMMLYPWNAPANRVQTVRAPAQLLEVVSRRPGAGTPERVFSLANPVGVESRRGANFNTSVNPNTGDYTVAFRFNSPVTQGTCTIQSGVATVGAITFNGNDMIVPLTGVNDKQLITFSLTGLVDNQGNPLPNLQPQLGFLVGDINGDGTVDVGDSILVRNDAGKTAAQAPASDVNGDGTVNSGDAIIVRGASGNAF